MQLTTLSYVSRDQLINAYLKGETDNGETAVVTLSSFLKDYAKVSLHIGESRQPIIETSMHEMYNFMKEEETDKIINYINHALKSIH